MYADIEVMEEEVGKSVEGGGGGGGGADRERGECGRTFQTAEIDVGSFFHASKDLVRVFLHLGRLKRE